MGYKPSANLETAKVRAAMYRRIRAFFTMKQVLEVETPVLCHSSVTDVQLESVTASFKYKDNLSTGYLHTSPEFAMKRLVAAWKSPIYQIAKVFRSNESGRKHNIEFSMLEWYRPEFTLEQLADELNELLNVLLGKAVVFNRISYQQAFLDFADIEPFSASIDELEQVAILRGIDSSLSRQHEHVSVMAHRADDKKSIDAKPSVPYTYSHLVNTRDAYSKSLAAKKNEWLDLLYSQLVEPELGKTFPTLIYDFPAQQAALAKTHLDADGNRVAKRFELYINGLELANAYDELTDSSIQRSRFEADNIERIRQGLPSMPVDHYLLASLDNMPSCSGISVGLDRLLMLICDEDNIANVLNFTTQQA